MDLQRDERERSDGRAAVVQNRRAGRLDIRRQHIHRGRRTGVLHASPDRAGRRHEREFYACVTERLIDEACSMTEETV